MKEIVVLRIYTKAVVRALVIAVLLITLASLAARFALFMWDEGKPLQPLMLFDVGEERSIPTWFASIQWLLCSVLLAVVTFAKRRRGDRYTLHWGALSAICLFLSVDEVATIHEVTGAMLERLVRAVTGFSPGGAISFFWVVPGAVFVLVVLLAYLRFLAHLPRETRRLFLFAGALFVVGALGIEMLTAQVMSSSESITSGVVSLSGGAIGRGSASAVPTILKGLQTSVEEMFEMLGLTAFIYALLAYIRSYEEISVRVGTDEADRNAKSR